MTRSTKKNLFRRTVIGAFTVALALGGYAYQANSAGKNNMKSNSNNQSMNNNVSVSELPENASITLTGNVIAIDEVEDEFILNYGQGTIQVATDEYYGKTFYEPSAEEYLSIGEQVTVSGYIDKDLFERREIDAHTIIKNNGTALYTTVNIPDFVVTYYEPIQGKMVLSGTVTNITGSEEFVLDYGTGTITVETDALENDPLANDAKNPLLVGEYIVVSGRVDEDFLEGVEFKANELTQIETL